MIKTKCLNCDYEQSTEEVFRDVMGEFTVCKNCDSSYDIEDSLKKEINK